MPKDRPLIKRLSRISPYATMKRLKIATQSEDEDTWDELRAYIVFITRSFLDASKTLGKQKSKLDDMAKKLVTDKPCIFGHDEVHSQIRLTCTMKYIEVSVFPAFRRKYKRQNDTQVAVIDSNNRDTDPTSSQPPHTSRSQNGPYNSASHNSGGMTTRRASATLSNSSPPSPPKMFAPRMNNVLSKGGKSSPRSRFKKPPTSKALPLLSSTQAQVFNPEPEAGPSAITASFARPSYPLRLAETELNGSSPRSELDDAAEAQATAERVRQARERAAAYRIRQSESRNLDALSIPTPPSSQPRIGLVNDNNLTPPLPSLQTSLSERFTPFSASFSVFQDRPRLTATPQAHGAFSSATASTSSSLSSEGVGARPSDFIGRFLSCSLPPLTHLHTALAHARLTEARIRGMGVRWAVGDIEEFLRRNLGALRDANGALVDHIDLTFLAHHCVYCFREGSGSWDPDEI
ncbi:hypothetical protein HYPSUDRAFT_66709 [Hypholoma sublateritium FD-334 SS-4]|uniref:Uncharacterized protein n=1 Tax=Hypholoma sublateritium (strain FD-334 SS-4) TaxID=945553 RepID=A0A0D2MH47_HYPSF|nr:hypothetical protein HYPSUDRAFT_66709 [Hypholoma sublateritium FD-334 SS-4]